MDADDTIGGAAQLRGGKLSGAREGFPFAAAAAGPGHRQPAQGTGRAARGARQWRAAKSRIGRASEARSSEEVEEEP